MEKNWLEKVLKESRALTVKDLESFGPKQKILPGDQIIGNVNNDLKKIFALSKKYVERAKNMFKEIAAFAEKVATEKKEMEYMEVGKQKMSELLILDSQAEAINQIFWSCLQSEFSMWNKDLGIREGWIVVSINPNIILSEMLKNVMNFSSQQSPSHFDN